MNVTGFSLKILRYFFQPNLSNEFLCHTKKVSVDSRFYFFCSDRKIKAWANDILQFPEFCSREWLLICQNCECRYAYKTFFARQNRWKYFMTLILSCDLCETIIDEKKNQSLISKRTLCFDSWCLQPLTELFAMLVHEWLQTPVTEI